VKLLAWLAGVGTLLGASAYMVVSLNRWEWNRALFFGLIVVMAEVGLATGLVLRKVEQLRPPPPDDDRDTINVLRATRGDLPDRFAWMKESTQGNLNVFITFLVGGGLIISGVGWLIDRLAVRTATPAGERLLAAQLESIRYPAGGLVLDDVTVLAQDTPGASDEQLWKLLRRARRT
jgi:hypothetical protein